MMSGSRKSKAVWWQLSMPGYQALPGKTVAGFEGTSNNLSTNWFNEESQLIGR